MRAVGIWTGTALAAFALPLPAWAQQAGADLAGVSAEGQSGAVEDEGFSRGDIVVTAEKRETRLQDVPAAITAVGGETLAKVGIFDQTQLSKVAPGLNIGAQGSNGVVFLRGVGQPQGSPNAQPGVAVNMNGVYLPRESGATPLFDLQRVEVLPGPQGTLYGRNAAGGAVNFITNRPVFRTEGSVTLEVGNYDLIHPTAVINLPVGDTVAIRAAGEYFKRDGYLANGSNDRDSYSGRLSVLVRPTDTVSGLVMANYTHEGGIGSNSILYSELGVRGQFNPTGDLWEQTFPTDQLSTDRDTLVLQGEFNLDLSDAVTLTYVPGFVDISSREVIQFQGVRVSPLDRFVRQYSQELRLSGSGARLDWLFGLFYYKASHEFISRSTPTTRQEFYNDLDSLAAFGQATYSLTDALRLTLGGRLSRDKFDGFARGTNPPFSNANPGIGGGSDTDTRIDWKVGAEYDVAPESMLYGTVQTGYLMGGFRQVGTTLFEPAKLTAYTAGSKNRFFDRILTVNLEGFYYDYKDYQLQYVQGTNFLTVNAPARVYGVQLDLVLEPTDNSTFNLGAVYQKGEITDSVGRYPRNGFGLVSIDGFELPNAPDLTITAGYTHTFDLANGGEIQAQVQTYYNSGYWMVFTHDLNTRQDDYTNTDLTLTYYAPGGGWSLGAWVRNLENEAVVIGANKPGAPAAGLPPESWPLAAPYINAPRTYGLRAQVSF